MNTKLEHLLACLGEECGEVQQILGKISRFGLFETYPKINKTNYSRLVEEVHDLVAVYEMVCSEIVIGSLEGLKYPEYIDRQRLDIKKNKVLKYMEYAREIGQLELEEVQSNDEINKE